MQLGLIISILFHAAILGGALVSLHSRPQLIVPEPEPVAVGMISPSELTKIRLGVRTAQLQEAEAKESPKGEVAKKEAAKAKVAAAAAPPPPPPPETKPDPAPLKAPEPPAAAPPPPVSPAEAQKKLDAEREAAEKAKAEQRKAAEQKEAEEQARIAEEQRRAEEQKKAEEQKRAEEARKAEERKRAEEQKRLEEERRQAELKKKREEEKKRREAALKKKREEEKKRREAEAKQKQFDADKIAALLNKVPDAAPPPPSAPPDQPTKAKGPALGAAEGRDKQISASEINMLRAQISTRLKSCWRLPSGGGGSDTPAVTLRWRLKPDGSLDGEPQVQQPRGDPLFLLAAEAAQRAVRECAPFDLPPERYQVWRVIIWDFDPSQMM